MSFRIYFFCFSIFFSSLLLAINGTYFGWVDDAMMANILQGISLPHPVYHPHELTGFAPAIIFFYKLFPSVAWYGWFIYAELFFAYLLLANIFFAFVQKQVGYSIVKISLVAMAFSLIMQEFVQRNNFTVTGCLLTGAGVLFLTGTKENSFKSFALAVLAILSGLLIRLEISIIVVVFALFASLLITILNNQKVKMVMVLFSVVISIALLFSVRYVCNNPDNIDFNELSFYEQLIQDAYIYPDPKTERDAIQLEAIRGFNQFDTHVLTKGNFKGMYAGFDLLPHFGQLVIRKLQMVYEFGNRYSAERDCFNWWNKNILLLFIAILYCFIAGWLGHKKKAVALLVLMILSCVGIILFVSVVAKMEDRLLYPLLLLLIFFMLCIICMKNSGATINLSIVLLPLFLFGSYRFIECRKAKVLLDEDIAAKRLFISELNGYSEKMIFFDMYTYYLLHLGPFENIHLCNDNEYSAGFHYLVRHFHSTRNYFLQKCGTDRVDKIMNCLYEKKDRVIFVYWDYNIDFLKRWNKVIYNQNLNLEPLAKKSSLSQANNTYIWEKMHYNYYTFK